MPDAAVFVFHSLPEPCKGQIIPSGISVEVVVETVGHPQSVKLTGRKLLHVEISLNSETDHVIQLWLRILRLISSYPPAVTGPRLAPATGTVCCPTYGSRIIVLGFAILNGNQSDGILVAALTGGYVMQDSLRRGANTGSNVDFGFRAVTPETVIPKNIVCIRVSHTDLSITDGC